MNRVYDEPTSLMVASAFLNLNCNLLSGEASRSFRKCAALFRGDTDHPPIEHYAGNAELDHLMLTAHIGEYCDM